MYPRTLVTHSTVGRYGHPVTTWGLLVLSFLLAGMLPAAHAAQNSQPVIVQLDPRATAADGTIQYAFIVTDNSMALSVVRVDLISRAASRFKVFRDGAVFVVDSQLGGSRVGLDLTEITDSGLAPGRFDHSSGNEMENPGADGFDVRVVFQDGSQLEGMMVNVGDSDDNDPSLWEFDSSNVSYGQRDEDRVLFTGDFETGTVSVNDWAYIESSFSDHSKQIKTVSDLARSGSYAAEFQLEESDPKWNGANLHGAQVVAKAPNAMGLSGDGRDDVSISHTSSEGVTRWYGVSTYFPSGSRIDPGPGFLTLLQLVSEADDDAGGRDLRGNDAVVNLEVTADGEYQIHRQWDASPYSNSAGANSNREKFVVGSIVRDAWVDWVFRVHWAYDKTGTLEVWRNGIKVVDVRDKPVCYNDNGGVEFKLGSLAGIEDLDYPKTVLVDEVRVGDEFASYADVAPGDEMSMVPARSTDRVDSDHTGSVGVSTDTNRTPAPVSGSSAAVFSWEGRVNAAGDDAEEDRETGMVNLSSIDLNLGYDGMTRITGMRFANIDIPNGAQILRAYVQFTADEIGTDSVSLSIRGENADSAEDYASSAGNISTRDVTQAQVSWSPEPWENVGVAGVAQRTADLSAIVQEIVNRSGWKPGNALAIMVAGNLAGKRTAVSFNGDADSAPVLYVDYAVGDGDDSLRAPNEAPVVDVYAPGDGAYYRQGDSINFTASVTDAEEGNITPRLIWESDIDGRIGTGGKVTRPDLSVGTHTVVASVTDSEGLSHSVSVTLTVAQASTRTFVWEGRVSAGRDDAEENLSTGKVYRRNRDLELAYDKAPQRVGLRFTDVAVPRGATIVKSYIQFTADEAHSDATTVMIEGQDADDASPFRSRVGNLSSRPTTPGVNWSPAAWNRIGEAQSAQRTPDLSSIVQAIVSRSRWESGNALAMLISSPSGAATRRVAESYEGKRKAAALLRVEYTLP
ncbi:MAG: heparin lyase I family protein [Pseudomonadota bacterium]